MTRYCRLWPPPIRRIEMWPWLSRPPLFFSGSTSDFSGVVRVMTSKSGTDRNRELLVTGLNCRMPMVSALKDLDRVAFLQRHDGLLPARPQAGLRADLPHFPPLLRRPHRRHLHAEE